MLNETELENLKGNIEAAKENVEIAKTTLRLLEGRLAQHEKEVELNKKKDLIGQCFIAKPWKSLYEKHQYENVSAFKILDVLSDGKDAKVVAVMEGPDRYGFTTKGIGQLIMPLWRHCGKIDITPLVIETFNQLEHESTFTQMAKHKFYQTLEGEENKNELHDGTIN